jgi:hypothetical protein
MILFRGILTWIVLINITSPFPKQILWFPAIEILIEIIGSSFWNIITWGFLVVETPAVLLSSIIPWKIVSEYRLLRVKAKLTGSLLKVLTLSSLKTSTFVIIYNINWLLKVIITFVLFICPNSIKNLSFLYFSSIVISTSNYFVSISSFCSNRPSILSNSIRNTLK